LRGR
jgi:hypothetical protein